MNSDTRYLLDPKFQRTIADRFWWPSLDRDLTWYIKTCHQCQIRSVEMVVIPPTVVTLAPLFRKAYTDSMHMPTSHGYSYIIDTDNGTPFVAALDWLRVAAKYHLRHIQISAYNSKANGIVERSQHTIRGCNGDITQWPALAHHVVWANRVTSRKSTGHTPFYMAHGVEPLLLFDITEATFLLPEVTTKLNTDNLVAIRVRQLAKRDEDVAIIHDRVLRTRLTSITDFEKRFANSIHDHDFKPGAFVLVLDKKAEAAPNAKCKPRYFGPMVVVSRSRTGSYRLAEVDGTISKLKFADFRLIPYHAHSPKPLDVTEFVNPEDLVGAVAEEE
ncbi:hypothetical protein HYDPIDRAFT_177375 [Hydnomerulius pinastri MD-312]|uniref:Integrase zinc-binding domain-containing protein n=1 Tax=Hydnomerulius pinastri MD-312 TaxID=994086 RepID=A0A0C9VRS4_9AGAM|nr:hypothetical protein HYDPIDRAFT_177375 [Hydnomerulius pinastri MD-312]